MLRSNFNKTTLNVVMARMMIKVPFYSTLLLQMMETKVGKFPGIPTAGTDDHTIWIDEEFLAGLTVHEAVGLLCHEVSHAMFHHMTRAKEYKQRGIDGDKFEHRLWNMAADYIINAQLLSAGFKLPAGGLVDPGITGDEVVEHVYRKLKKEEDSDAGKSSGGGGSGSGSGGGGSGFDIHIEPADQPSTGDAQEADAKWKQALVTALVAARTTGQGDIPASLRRQLEGLLETKVPWEDTLQLLMLNAVSGNDDTTWRRPHYRRLRVQGLYMPTETGRRCDCIVLVVDTSGSIDEELLRRFVTEAQAVIDICRPEVTYLLAVDAHLHETHEIGDERLDEYLDQLSGGGGTCFTPAFEWIEEQGIQPDVLVYLTDMYGSFPSHAPDYPVIWAATSEREGPFGRTVYIDE